MEKSSTGEKPATGFDVSLRYDAGPQVFDNSIPDRAPSSVWTIKTIKTVETVETVETVFFGS